MEKDLERFGESSREGLRQKNLKSPRESLSKSSRDSVGRIKFLKSVHLEEEEDPCLFRGLFSS